ncbi:MAG: serine/threonine protein kinase [Steroidobacteraceae bacterium]
MELPSQSEADGNPQRVEPRSLGKYPLLGVIGKGSMGILYRSVDPHIKRPVALKTIRRDLLEQAEAENFSARFRIEAQAAGGLAHPGIVAVYEYGEEDAYAYIAMEYIEGRSLRECFEQKVPFSIGQVVSILLQLLEALQYAHDRGVWHRDIKPANILVMTDGRVKVTDFGIARIESSMLTQVGAIMGTPGFIAPEMYLGDTFDSRVDVFAAGVVLYQLLAGTPPFLGTAEKVMFKVCYETPVPPSVAGRLPSLQAFDSVVMKALARRPEDRFMSAVEFRGALLEAQAHAGGAGSSDETIIQPRPEAPTSARESTSRPPSTNTLVGGGWNMDDLAQVEKRLARVVGPIARVMVRRAAKETTDIVALLHQLASKIISVAEREEFLKGAGLASARAPLAAHSRLPQDATGAPQSGSFAGVHRPLTADDVARASQLLVTHIGPIAPVLAKRAAKPGASREQFIAALASHLRDDAARARFLDALR